ncbi:hypothetical protein PROFUN_15888 [Planoprotostelium fungivorum]|uniref:Uncharacterized protein n=1 Tax=Planoprotostelium fungivorum TaxID=1890364 RepID=A0A2P6MUA0_9EUKA|nr:hypothetical protein PROFUN_15888 [Planoprotostelium fungivorum]
MRLEEASIETTDRYTEKRKELKRTIVVQFIEGLVRLPCELKFVPLWLLFNKSQKCLDNVNPPYLSIVESILFEKLILECDTLIASSFAVPPVMSNVFGVEIPSRETSMRHHSTRCKFQV